MSEAAVTILMYVEGWIIFTKMGLEGWKSLIPFYNIYVEFEEIYGDGWRFLLILVPFYGIYIWIKFNIDLAAKFHKSEAFGAGLALLYPIFAGILAFGDDVYEDGSEAIQDDALKNGINNIFNEISGNGNRKETSSEILDAISKLDKLHEDGVIADEEYRKKKDELINRL